MCNGDALNASESESEVLVLCRFVPSVLSCFPISRTVLFRAFCFQMTLLSLSLNCQRQDKLAETYSFAITLHLIIIIIIITTINIIIHYPPTPPALVGVSCRDNSMSITRSVYFPGAFM